LLVVLLPLLLLCLPAFFAPDIAAKETVASPDFTKVDEALDLAIRERRLVGAVLMAAHDGKTVYAKAVGLPTG
jgi:hypothetical protein